MSNETKMVRAEVGIEVHRRLKHLAIELGLSLAELVSQILSAYVGIGAPPPVPNLDAERAYGNAGPQE